MGIGSLQAYTSQSETFVSHEITEHWRKPKNFNQGVSEIYVPCGKGIRVKCKHA